MPTTHPFLKGYGKKKPVMKKKIRITKTVAVRPMKDTAKASVMTLVKNLINKKAETKYVTRLPENNVDHNSAIGGADIVNLVPDIVQGTEDYQRLGDSIKPMSMVVRGHLSINGDAAYTNRVLLARLFILSAKSYKTSAAITTNAAAIANSLLRPNYEGGPYVKPFSGDTSDLYQPVIRMLIVFITIRFLRLLHLLLMEVLKSNQRRVVVGGLRLIFPQR